MKETLRVHLSNVVRELEHPTVPLPPKVGHAVEEASRRMKPFLSRPSVATVAVSVDIRVPVEPIGGHVNKYKLYDLPSDAGLLRAASVGLSEREVLRIQDALRSLAHRVRHLSWLRFWGKLLGSETDYYVAEAVVHGGYFYFVATERGLRRGGECWHELPSVTAEQIRQSRDLKKILTGRWDAPVDKTGQFPGCEINLVRALIARISANTTIAPDGYFAADDTAGLVKTADEDFDVTAVDLTSLDNWRYVRDYIYPSGLTSLPEDDKTETEPVGKLAALNASQFGVRLDGDRSVVRSKKWPGAVTVATRTTWTSIYVGYGLETGGKLMPVEYPKRIQQEPTELAEQTEPFPLEDDTVKPVPEDETAA